MHRREQRRNDQRTHPGIDEKLRAETSQQVGYTTRQLNYIPNIITVEKEKLKLFLIMQMMRIGQSEKEEDCQSEKESANGTKEFQNQKIIKLEIKIIQTRD